MPPAAFALFVRVAAQAPHGLKVTSRECLLEPGVALGGSRTFAMEYAHRRSKTRLITRLTSGHQQHAAGAEVRDGRQVDGQRHQQATADGQLVEPDGQRFRAARIYKNGIERSESAGEAIADNNAHIPVGPQITFGARAQVLVDLDGDDTALRADSMRGDGGVIADSAADVQKSVA